MRVRRVVAAGVGAWLSLFAVVPAFAAAPTAGSAAGSALQVKVSPFAVVPLSSLSALPGSSLLTALSGDISVAADQATVKGVVSNHAFSTSEGHSQPIVIQVAALANELKAIENLLNSLTSSNPDLVATVEQQLDATLSKAGLSNLDQYIQQAEGGSIQATEAVAKFPSGPLTDTEAFLPKSTGGALIEQTQVLVPYSANASASSADATTTLDSLGLINGGPNLNAALTSLNGLLNTLQTTLDTLNSATASGVTTVSGTLSGTIDNLLPAGTPVNSATISSVQQTITQVTNLKATLTALNASLADLSQVVATNGVATSVKTTSTAGGVLSTATTKVAAIDLVTVNAPQLTSLLGVAQGKALVSIIGATSTASAQANGVSSKAFGSASFTRISALAGTALETNICYAAVDCAGLKNPVILSDKLAQTGLATCLTDASGAPTCTVTAGPLSIVIEASHACACTDMHTNGGDATFASASTTALRVLVNFSGTVSNLLAATTASAPAAAATTNLATVQLANSSATAGDVNAVVQGIHAPSTGSPFGAGLLVAMMLLILAGGFGLSYRMGWLPVRK